MVNYLKTCKECQSAYETDGTIAVNRQELLDDFRGHALKLQEFDDRFSVASREHYEEHIAICEKWDHTPDNTILGRFNILLKEISRLEKEVFGE
jgi:hypothetical protein